MPESLLPNILQFISQIDPFDKVPKISLRSLASEIKIRYLRKGEEIESYSCDQDKCLYIVRTGSIEQRKSNGVLRAKLGPDDLFGFTFLGNNIEPSQQYKATALEHSLIYIVPNSALQKLFSVHPELAEHFASQAQLRLKSALDVVWSNKEKGLFIKQVSDIASQQVAVVQASQSIQDVATEMMNKCSPCAVVYDHETIIGVITDRDMTKRVISQRVNIDNPISTVITKDPLTVHPEDLVLHAASIMMQHNIRNLPVVENNKVVGILTTSHLVQNHRVQAVFLIEKIKYAENVKSLSSYTPERQAIFEALVEGKVSPEIIGRVMTMIMDAYTRRLIQIAIDKLGPPPCEFSWIVAGSHARNEVHMLSDQDSAIVYADNATANDKIYFKHLAMIVSKGLASCDYPLCSGKFMAVTPQWCQPLSIWKSYYKKWVANPEYERLLNITVFLEIRTVYGNEAFEQILRNELHSDINKNKAFLSMLVNDAVSVSPPLGIFNSLVLEKSGENQKTLNVKKYAINLIIDLARIYGLSSACESSTTDERFKIANEKGLLSDDAYKNITNAYQFISSFRFAHQLEALKKGVAPDNHIDPNTFGSFERKHLKDAFRIIADLQEAAKIRFGATK